MANIPFTKVPFVAGLTKFTTDVSNAIQDTLDRIANKANRGAYLLDADLIAGKTIAEIAPTELSIGTGEAGQIPIINTGATAIEWTTIAGLSVIEYANLAAFPGTGNTTTVYKALDTAKVYRWTGTGYTEISASLALGETSAAAYRGDRGKIAYDYSLISASKTVKGGVTLATKLNATDVFNSEDTVDLINGGVEKTFGYIGTDATYASAGITRIQGEPFLQKTRIRSIKLFVNNAGSFKILEVTRNTDGTINYVRTILTKASVIGNNEYVVDEIISAGSYIGFWSSTVTLSYISTGGTAINVVGEVTGDNHDSTDAVYVLNFSVIGTPVGMVTIQDELDDIYSGKTAIYGNEQAGTGSSTINRVNLLATPTLLNGRAKKLNVLASSAGAVLFIEYKMLPGGNFSFYKILGSFPVASGANSFTIDYYIEKDIYLGFFSDSAVIVFADRGAGFYFASTGLLSSSVTPTVTSANFALNLEIEYIGINKIEEDIHGLKNDLLEGVLFDATDAIPSTFYNDGGWVGTGCPASANSLMYFNKAVGFEKLVGVAVITLLDASPATILVMCQGTGGLYVTFDIANALLKIHTTWDGTPATVPDVVAQEDITIALTQNRKYILVVEKNTIEQVTATIYDAATTESNSVTHLTTGDANLHGNGVTGFGLLHKAGVYTRNRFFAHANGRMRPRVMIFGDSYVEGYNLLRYSHPFVSRYPTLLSDAIDGDIAISCKGGEDTWGLLDKLTTDFAMVSPKYTLLAIGLNDCLNATSTFIQLRDNLSLLINAAREAGSIPILATLPRLTTGVLDQINSWIRSYSGCRYVDIQIVTSNNGTTTGTPAAALFLADGHPNVAGNLRIYNRLKIDCPYLFYER
jgi:hypothetical protein